MPIVQITNEQRDAATANGQDAADAFELGIFDEAFALVSPPLSGYDGFTPAVKQTIKDGCKQFFAISSRYFSPISGSVHVSAPSFSIVTDVAVASMTITTYIPRNVLITLNLSAYTDTASTGAGFYAKVNGGGISPSAQYFFNTSSDHRSMGASWVTTLPAGVSTIEALVGRASGGGRIVLDANDHIALTVMG